MIANYLMFISALIIGLLGLAHLDLTYRGPKLLPRDPGLKSLMEKAPLVITSQTSYWRAWIGFNASHSLGAIMFGLIYGYLALFQGGFLFGSWFFLTLGLAALVAYVVMAKLYWFRTPLVGISLSLLLYILSVVLSRV